MLHRAFRAFARDSVFVFNPFAAPIGHVSFVEASGGSLLRL